jgi:hypothetical protein
MFKKRFYNGCGLAIVMTLILGLSLPAPARADGGIIIPDSQLWAMIGEGQQTAVISLKEDGTAQVDLFISMADRSGTAHEVTFFIPLGNEARNFEVAEETSLAFDKTLTAGFDNQLKEQARREASYKNTVATSLLVGPLLTNGTWSWIILFPVLMAGCMQAAAPIATFKTESSYVAIYKMDENTDVQALIETSGLDASVIDTLKSYQGQQIAVIQLQTQPQAEGGQSSSVPTGQPGIHLGWISTLVSHSAEATYTYPLGTGRAWASPIELTRVYVVSPAGMDFSVQYPELGNDLSGIAGSVSLAQNLYWRIDESPAYAIEQAYGDFGRIWRATYIKSNASQDIVVTRLPGITPQTRAALQHLQSQNTVIAVTWFLSLLAGLLCWVVAWGLIMPRLLKMPYSWRSLHSYTGALKWSLLYPAASLAVAAIIGVVLLVFSFLASVLPGNLFNRIGDLITSTGAGVLVVGIFIFLPLLVTISGMVNAYFFARRQAPRLEVSKRRAFGVYLLVVLVANMFYMMLAAGYIASVGAIGI